MAIKAPRGTADILPKDAPLWPFVEKTAAETARNFGYEEIRTPVFEHTELFQRGVGDTTDVVQKEMYTFTDKGDRSITLRPEGTASAARAYIEHSMQALPQPVKLYYAVSCYRYEKPQAGRLREFHQFGIEAFGSEDPALDAEIIALGSTLFKNLGIRGLSVNLNSIGCPEKNITKHLRHTLRRTAKRFAKPAIRVLRKTLCVFLTAKALFAKRLPKMHRTFSNTFATIAVPISKRCKAI